MTLFPKGGVGIVKAIRVCLFLKFMNRFLRGGRIMKRITLCFGLLALLLAVNATAATEEAKQQAIDDGLAWLAATQTISGAEGYWSYGNDGTLATTASAALAFIEEGYLPGDLSVYDGVITRAVTYIFNRATVDSRFGVETDEYERYAEDYSNDGPPYDEGNNQAIYFEPGASTRRVYTTGIVAPVVYALGEALGINTVVGIGSPAISGKTYAQAMQDIVDWFVWGQVEPNRGNYRGGWRYDANYVDSDNSTAQWGALPLLYAADWGLGTPQYVFDELELWVDYIQDDVSGGSGYNTPTSYLNMSKTGGLLLELSAIGAGPADPRVVAALGFIDSRWNTTVNATWYGNFNNPYAMWAVYKGLSVYGYLIDFDCAPGEILIGQGIPSAPGGFSICFSANLATSAVGDWYSHYCDYLVGIQNGDGSWTGAYNWTGALATGWYINILNAVPVPPLNEPPVAVCRDITVVADDNCEADASIDDGSYDPDGDPITLTQTPPGPYPLGETTVTLEVTDDSGASDTCTGVVTVIDTMPPEIVCPSADITVECADYCGVPSDDPQLTDFFSSVSATDACCTPAEITITSDAPDCFPLGMTMVTFTATDCNGNEAECTANVTVEDTTPPEITVTLNRDVLWPPNHKMVDIFATVTTSDVCCEAPTFVLISATSNEPDNDIGDGNTVNDIQDADVGTADTHILLRSERRGGYDGRIYTLVYEATDCVGNTTEASATVRVPHDQSGHAVCSMGFGPAGVELDPALDQFVLVIPSNDTFDATALDAARTFVGNTAGVVLPDRVMEIDNNADELTDLALYYPAKSMSVFDGSEAIGLHYTSAEGVDYLVSDIFALGNPVPLVPEIEIANGDIGSDTTAPSGQDAPAATALLSAYPNPFNPSTTIPFSLETQQTVTLRIYDARGKLIRTLENSSFPAGSHQTVWDGRDNTGESVSTGVYFVRLVAGSYEETRKLVLVK